MANLVKTDVIAQVFEVSVRRIQQLTQEGIIKTTKDPDGGARKYDLIPTVQEYIRYLSNKSKGRASTEKEVEWKQKKLEAEVALKESQAELHKLRTEIAGGKYISVDEVTLDYQKFFVVFKKFALAIPNRIGGQIAGYVDPVIARAIEKDMTNEIASMHQTFIVSAGSGGDKE